MLHKCLLILAAGALLCAQANPSVQGHVFSTDGSRIGGVTVAIAGASTFVAVTETGTDPGHYASPAIPVGSYTITVKKDGYRSLPAKSVTVNQEGLTVDFVMQASCTACGVEDGKITPWHVNGLLTLGAVLLFLASIWGVRWHNIACPNRELLRAEIDNERARFQNETGIDLNAPEMKYLRDLLDSAGKAIVWNWRTSWFDFLFWTRGQEITGWTRIHEFQRGSVKYLATQSTLDTIRARLQAITLDLLDIDKTHAKTFAANIKDALAEQPPDEHSLRALLVEALFCPRLQDAWWFQRRSGADSNARLASRRVARRDGPRCRR
jgi:carboxypeptidase family protein